MSTGQPGTEDTARRFQLLLESLPVQEFATRGRAASLGASGDMGRCC